jgi:C_GCAxxG_C_C family probable redox protein
VLAVGEYLWGQVDERIRCMTTGLAGGVGDTRQELCGALSGGVLLIGALYGRTRPDEDDGRCLRLASRYREQFAGELGTTRCFDLRASGYGSDGKWPCSVLVERATRVLLETLAIEHPVCGVP